MPSYPNTPRPSSVSPPAIIDPHWVFETDSGVSIRRVKHSRPVRRWTLEYLGMNTDQMRAIRGFLQQVRLGTVEFAWVHPTGVDTVGVYPTTPVTIVYAWETAPTSAHGLFTGQSILVSNTPNANINGGSFAVTVIDAVTVTLQGSVAGGIAGTGNAQTHVPRARAIMAQDGTFDSPAVLIGPEQTLWPGYRTGLYNFQVTLEEVL